MKDEIKSHEKRFLKNIYVVFKLVTITKNWNEMNHYYESGPTKAKSKDKEHYAEEKKFLPTISGCWTGEVLFVYFSLLL